MKGNEAVVQAWADECHSITSTEKSWLGAVIQAVFVARNQWGSVRGYIVGDYCGSVAALTDHPFGYIQQISIFGSQICWKTVPLVKQVYTCRYARIYTQKNGSY